MALRSRPLGAPKSIPSAAKQQTGAPYPVSPVRENIPQLSPSFLTSRKKILEIRPSPQRTTIKRNTYGKQIADSFALPHYARPTEAAMAKQKIQKISSRLTAAPKPKQGILRKKRSFAPAAPQTTYAKHVTFSEDIDAASAPPTPQRTPVSY